MARARIGLLPTIGVVSNSGGRFSRMCSCRMVPAIRMNAGPGAASAICSGIGTCARPNEYRRRIKGWAVDFMVDQGNSRIMRPRRVTQPAPDHSKFIPTGPRNLQTVARSAVQQNGLSDHSHFPILAISLAFLTLLPDPCCERAGAICRRLRSEYPANGHVHGVSPGGNRPTGSWWHDRLGRSAGDFRTALRIAGMGLHASFRGMAIHAPGRLLLAS